MPGYHGIVYPFTLRELCDKCHAPAFTEPFVIVIWQGRPAVPFSLLHQRCWAQSEKEHG